MPEESTTPDLVELVRSFAESAPVDLDAFLGFFADDAVWEAVPLGTSYHGVKEIRAFLTDWMGSYDSMQSTSRRSAISATALSWRWSTRQLVWWAAPPEVD